MLSISVVLLSISGHLIYNAMLVFVVQGVSRTLLASFSACNGMFSAFFSACIQVVCGRLIDLSGGNYAIAYPFGIVFGAVGIPLLILVSRGRQQAARAEAAAGLG